MCLLTLLAGVLRLFMIGSESFWIDEMATFERVSMSWHDMFDVILSLKYHPPLHYCLVKAWCSVAGYDETSLRFISAIAGAIATPFFYFTAFRLSGRKAALIATSMFVVSAYHIRWAQEARFYSLMGLLSCVSMYYFIVLLQQRNKRALLAYIFASALMMYNHYFSLFLILAQNLAVLTELILSYVKNKSFDSKGLKAWIIAQVSIILLFLPWLLVLLQGLGKYDEGFKVLKKPGIEALLAVPYFYAERSIILAAIFTASLFLFTFGLLKKGKFKLDFQKIGEKQVVLWWFIVPFLVPFIISVLLTPIYSGRYILAGSFGFFIIASEGLLRLKGKVRHIAIAIFFLSMALVLTNYYAKPFNEQWKPAAAYIAKNASPDDVVIIHPAFCLRAFNFYADKDAPAAVGFPLPKQKIEGQGPTINEQNAPLIDLQIANAQNVWILYCHSYDKNYQILKHLSKKYKQTDKVALHKIEIYEYSKQPNNGQ